MLVSTGFTGPTLSGLKIHAQSNQTNSDTSAFEDDDNDAKNIEQEKSTTNLTNTTPNSNNQNVPSKVNQADESSLSKPDGDCLFDPSLSKCAPDESGNCPEGFNMNEDGQCFPVHDGCPDGYHSADDDETGRCIPNSEECPSGMIFRPDMKTCGYKEDVCNTYPGLDECKVMDNKDGKTSKASFNSGYNHGCSDIKISDPSKRYINQPGKGPSYHTSNFMNGYYDGFDYCSIPNNETAYDSGYKHGCNDGIIPDEAKRYINQPGKGPSYHTSNFMNGYYDGFGDCLKPGNKSPVAEAGLDKIELFGGQTISLDARNSYDPDGKIVKYEWRNGVNADPGCPYGKFTNKNSPTPQFAAPTSLTKDCSNWYEVVVTDNYGKRGVDAILITVKQL